MKNISTRAELKLAIELLEAEQALAGFELKEQFFITYDGLKPASILRNVITEMVTPPHLVENLVGTALSMASGYLSKKLMEGDSPSPMRQMLGSLLQMGVSHLVSKNTDTLQSFGQILYQQIFKKKTT